MELLIAGKVLGSHNLKGKDKLNVNVEFLD